MIKLENATSGISQRRAKTRRSHSTVPIQWDGKSAKVDAKIAPLVLEMWRAGIETYQSCQSNPPGWVWLQFEASQDLERFLTILARHIGDDNVSRRMEFGYNRPDGPNGKHWWYRVVAEDISLEDLPTDSRVPRCEPPLFALLLNVHFPRTDLEKVFQALREHNQLRHCSWTCAR